MYLLYSKRKSIFGFAAQGCLHQDTGCLGQFCDVFAQYGWTDTQKGYKKVSSQVAENSYGAYENDTAAAKQ